MGRHLFHSDPTINGATTPDSQIGWRKKISMQEEWRERIRHRFPTEPEIVFSYVSPTLLVSVLQFAKGSNLKMAERAKLQLNGEWSRTFPLEVQSALLLVIT